MKQCVIFFLLTSLLFSCSKSDNEPSPAQLSTTTISNITPSGATGGGNITSDGGASVTARGICWAITQNPTTADSKTSDGTGTGSFSSSITGLSPNVTYYVRAYASNSAGTAYGSQVSFTSIANAATLTTANTVSIAATTAMSGGNITNDGGAAITARGVCWSTTANPTIANSKTLDGTGTGSFISSLTGLTPATTYYIRAYATNLSGTSYGTELSFITSATIAILTTVTASPVGVTNAVSGGSISNNGGSPVNLCGVCWNTSPNPTVANSKTLDVPGSGIYTSTLTGLAPATTYYARAYAQNGAGTAYGNEISFTTQALPAGGVLIGTQVWTNKNLDVTTYRNGDVIPEVTDPVQWTTLTTGAWCYYANQTANGTEYGKLYNWYAVNDPRGLAPAGWHVPTRDEFVTLINYLSQPLAGGKLKETGLTHWNTPNTGASNSSGFSAVGSGFRSYFDGSFVNLKVAANYWTASGYDATTAHNAYVRYDEAASNTVIYLKNSGYAIRCVKD